MKRMQEATRRLLNRGIFIGQLCRGRAVPFLNLQMIKTRRTLDVAQEKGPRLHRQHFPWFVRSAWLLYRKLTIRQSADNSNQHRYLLVCRISSVQLNAGWAVLFNRSFCHDRHPATVHPHREVRQQRPRMRSGFSAVA